MKRISTLLVMLIGISYCNAQSSQKDTIQKETLDTMSVTAKAGKPPYQPSAPRIWDIKHTRIALTFNYTAKTAAANEWITLRPYFYAVDSVVLDAKGMHIDSVMLQTSKGKTPLQYRYEDDQLTIRFGRAYKSTEEVILYLKYTAMPYASQSGGSSSIRDDRGLYFINTDHKVPHKPAQIWTQGETESNSHWMVTIDKPNARFTTQVELTVPDSFITLSNGAMVKSVKSSKGLRTDIWKMDKPIQAYVVMFAIGKFVVDKNLWRTKEVNYYVEPEFAPYAYLMFNHTREMMEFFSKRTGVLYPWNKYSQVVVRDYVSGAMENTSATLLGEFMNQNAREVADRNYEDVVSHELFHQWFGDYVNCESWSNVTVNESFANYGEQLWRSFRYGKASGDELAYNDLRGYLGYSTFSDPQLVRFRYDSREEVFDGISYNKGGAILHYLNDLVGDEAFDKAMNLYLTHNALKPAEADQWRLALEEATGLDWNWFFDQWYFHPGHPVLRLNYEYDDAAQQLSVIVNQTQTDSTFLYNLPLKAALIYGKEKTVINWAVNKRTDTFKYRYQNGERPVFIPDYSHVLPGDIRENKKMPEWRVQYLNTDDYVSKRLAVDAASRHLSDTNSQRIIDLAFADFLHPIRSYALSQVSKTSNTSYRKRWDDYIISMAKYDSDKQVRTEAYDLLGDWKVAAAKETMVQGVHYSSYLIAGAALGALAKIDADTAYLVAKEMLKTDPKSTLETTIWSVICKKANDDDIALIEQYSPWIFGTKRFSFLSSLKTYMKNVKSDESFKRCAVVFEAIVSSEGLRTYRALYGGYLIQVASDEKDKTESEKAEEAGVAKRRLELMKPILQKMVVAEEDAATRKEYESKLAALNK